MRTRRSINKAASVKIGSNAKWSTRPTGPRARTREIPIHLFRVGHYVESDVLRDLWALRRDALRRYPKQIWRIFEVHTSPITQTWALMRTH